MYRIKTMNKIASAGLDQLDKSRFQVGEDVENEDGILVRSAKMHDYVFPDALRAIARAGAGTNNIPIDRCSESGIVVFNTPGANANAVKELVIAALETGRVAKYVTDFPNDTIATVKNVIAMPHLGASTPESEQNCAAMAVDELTDYLENGNIRRSVNLPDMVMDRSGVERLCILHKNVPGMLANITSLFGRDGVNVENLINKSRGEYAYTMVDLGTKVAERVIEDVQHMANVIRVRVLEW